MNYTGSIAYHIIPLVIDALRGGHIRTYMHVSISTLQTKAISRNQMSAWFKNSLSRLMVVSHEAKEEAASSTPTDSRLTLVSILQEQEL